MSQEPFNYNCICVMDYTDESKEFLRVFEIHGVDKAKHVLQLLHRPIDSKEIHFEAIEQTDQNIMQALYQYHFDNNMSGYLEPTCKLYRTSIQQFTKLRQHLEDDLDDYTTTQFVLLLPSEWEDERLKSMLYELFGAAGWRCTTSYSRNIYFFTERECFVHCTQALLGHTIFEREKRYLLLTVAKRKGRHVLNCDMFDMLYDPHAVRAFPDIWLSEIPLAPRFVKPREPLEFPLLSEEAIYMFDTYMSLEATTLDGSPIDEPYIVLHRIRNYFHDKDNGHFIKGSSDSIPGITEKLLETVDISTLIEQLDAFLKDADRTLISGVALIDFDSYISASDNLIEALSALLSCFKLQPHIKKSLGVNSIGLGRGYKSHVPFYGALFKLTYINEAVFSILPPIVLPDDDSNRTVNDNNNSLVSQRQCQFNGSSCNQCQLCSEIPLYEFYAEVKVVEVQIKVVLFQLIKKMSGCHCRTANYQRLVYENNINIESLTDFISNALWKEWMGSNSSTEEDIHWDKNACSIHNINASIDVTLENYKRFKQTASRGLMQQIREVGINGNTSNQGMSIDICLQDSCRCRLNISHHWLAELGFRSYLRTISSHIVTALNDTHALGRYGVSYLLIDSSFAKQQDSTIRNYYQDCYIQTFDQELQLAVRRKGMQISWHIELKSSQLLEKSDNSTNSGSYQQVSSRTHLIQINEMPKYEIYEDEGNVWTRIPQTSINERIRTGAAWFFPAIKKNDIIPPEGIKKIFYVVGTEDYTEKDRSSRRKEVTATLRHSNDEYREGADIDQYLNGLENLLLAHYPTYETRFFYPLELTIKPLNHYSLLDVSLSLSNTYGIGVYREFRTELLYERSTVRRFPSLQAPVNSCSKKRSIVRI